MSLPPLPQNLTPLDVSAHEFIIPRKEIHTATDVAHFLTSPAYKRITAFINHLNASVSPLATTELQTQQQSSSPPNEGFIKPAVSPERFATNSPNITVSPEVQGIIDLVKELESYVGLCPPEKGPRRFGNVAFRTWHKMVEEKLNEVLDKYVPKKVLATLPQSGKVSARDELAPYLLGSFGSAQRLDYGTGHELSFLAFLCGLYVLNGFEPGRDEPALALRCVDAYLHLIRTLVKTYTLEPAGSHGVWGLDDHTFIPYIFGSSQLTTHAPVSGIVGESVEGVPAPGDITKANIVEQQRDRNLYFGAVGFIYDVKRGPFWEHSPILYDVSGVKEGWGKINIVGSSMPFI